MVRINEMSFIANFFIFIASFLACSHAHAKQVTILFGVDRPPYIFGRESKGIDYEIVKTAFAAKGYEMKSLHSPNTKGLKELRLGKVQGMVGVAAGIDKRLFFSEPYAQYNNVIVTKKKRNIKLEKLDDLKNYRFMAFQGASEYLGDRYAKVASSVGRQTEIASQRDQCRLFWLDKVDAIILDINVFKWYRRHLDMNTSDEYVIHDNVLDKNVVGLNSRVVVFTDVKVRDDFNDGLKTLKASSAYQDIFTRYLSGL